MLTEKPTPTVDAIEYAATSREIPPEYLEQLIAGLREAGQHRGINDRKAAGIALEAILHFLYDQKPITKECLHRPLYELLAGLQDLEDGRTPALLRANKVLNRPPRGSLRADPERS
jgi:hypothetical protein